MGSTQSSGIERRDDANGDGLLADAGEPLRQPTLSEQLQHLLLDEPRQQQRFVEPAQFCRFVGGASRQRRVRHLGHLKHSTYTPVRASRVRPRCSMGDLPDALPDPQPAASTLARVLDRAVPATAWLRRHETALWWLHSGWALAIGIGVLWLGARNYAWLRVTYAYVAFIWLASFALPRLLRSPRIPAPWHRPLQLAVNYFVKNFYQQLLFFVLPVYWASTTFGARNSWFVVLVAASAVLSTFDVVYDRYLSAKRHLTAVFFGFNLFACVNVVLPVLWSVSTAAALRISAALAVLGMMSIAVERPRLRRRSTTAGLVLGSLAVAALVEFGRPLIPPAPLRVVRAEFGDQIQRQPPVIPRPLTTLGAGFSGRLYLVTAISAPLGLRDRVRHVWSVDGRACHGITSLRGDRRQGAGLPALDVRGAEAGACRERRTRRRRDRGRPTDWPRDPVEGGVMPRYKLTIEYAGTRYSGWQIQKNARTVAGEIERAVEEAAGRPAGELYGSGRTDAGVHAIAQVAHLDLSSSWTGRELAAQVNACLPHDIVIVDAERVTHRFHARHSAVSRSYLYQVARRKSAFGKPFVWWVRDTLDAAAMERAAEAFAGFHDFRAFADNDPEQESTLVALDGVTVKEAGDLVLIRVEGSHFLWKMVRRIVGVLVEAGRGGLRAADVDGLLDGDSDLPPRLTAPPSGLFLEHVWYPGDTRDLDIAPVMRL